MLFQSHGRMIKGKEKTKFSCFKSFRWHIQIVNKKNTTNDKDRSTLLVMTSLEVVKNVKYRALLLVTENLINNVTD